MITNSFLYTVKIRVTASMLYHLALFVKSYWSVFNVVHYISFRAIAALLTALCSSLLLGSWFIAKSQQFFRAGTREWLPENHKNKGEMPTMGGIFVIMAVAISMLLWCNLTHAKIWIFLLCLVGFGGIGLWDDWCKIFYKKGVSAAYKFRLQWFIAGVVAIAMVVIGGVSTKITFPFFKTFNPDLGFLYIPWAMFIMVACSNAVNLTDGLDGLAVGSLLPNFATFAFMCFVAGNHMVADYLHIPYCATGEIAIAAAALFGACLGFLWYNSYPAQIFMGDVGSLAFGASLGLMALMAKQEILLVIAGGLFVVEVVSVMAQVWSVRYRGKRLFKMAPIHHHFELLGWPESKITVRFAIVSLVLCLLAVLTLKIR